MRIQNGFIALIGLLLVAATTLGSVYSDQFAQASVAQTSGFDALAHAIFDDVFGAEQQLR